MKKKTKSKDDGFFDDYFLGVMNPSEEECKELKAEFLKQKRLEKEGKLPQPIKIYTIGTKYPYMYQEKSDEDETKPVYAYIRKDIGVFQIHFDDNISARNYSESFACLRLAENLKIRTLANTIIKNNLFSIKEFPAAHRLFKSSPRPKDDYEEILKENNKREHSIFNNYREHQWYRIRVLKALTEQGSVTKFDDNYDITLTGPVAMEKRLDIVMGGLASGKTTQMTYPLSKKYHSWIADANLTKFYLPDYGNGLLPYPIESESWFVTQKAMEIQAKKGLNIVFELIGVEKEALEKIMESFDSIGYEIHLHFVELKAEEAAKRAKKRFLDTGIFSIFMNNRKNSTSRTRNLGQDIKQGIKDFVKEIDDFAEFVAKETGTTALIADVKGKWLNDKFVPRKAIDKDIVRNIIIVNSVEQANEVIAILVNDSHIEYDETKDYYKHPTEVGYRGLSVDYNKIINGTTYTGEIQVNIPEMMFVKEDLKRTLALFGAEEVKRMTDAGLQPGIGNKNAEEMRRIKEKRMKE